MMQYLKMGVLRKYLYVGMCWWGRGFLLFCTVRRACLGKRFLALSWAKMSVCRFFVLPLCAKIIKHKQNINMETSNKFIRLSYSLYDVTQGSDGEERLIERTTDDRPFIFISGMGVTLPAFEAHVAGLEAGQEFDFTLEPSEAYGERFEERVVELDKQIFTIDGKFDAEHVQVGAIIPLQNEDGNRFNAVVQAISDTKVTVDLNHPLAGVKLNFCGEILESREATLEEVAKMAQLMSGEGGCGGCSGGCKEGNCGEGGCKDGGCQGGCH